MAGRSFSVWTGVRCRAAGIRRTQWLEQHLAKYPGMVVAVTHDRFFLDNVAGWILELDRGHAYPYEGNYST